MRILFIAPYVPSLIRVRPYNLIRELTRLGHEVTVLALVFSPGEREQIEALSRHCHRAESVYLPRARSLWNCLRALPTLTPLQAAYCFSPRMDARIREELAAHPYDVLHVEHLRAAHFGRSTDGPPKVYDAVDSISLLQERTLHHGLLRSRLLALQELPRTRRYESRIVGEFDRVLVTSRADCRSLESMRPDVEITVLRNGVDLDYFARDGFSEGPDTLIFTGKMSYHANVSGVLHFARSVFPLIKARKPGVHLQIVGSSPPAAVRRLAADGGISVTGYVPDMRPYFAQATVAVCPMLVKVGISNKILEAMAMNVPVVSTQLACEGLEVTPEENILVGDSPFEFAAQVIRMLETRDTRRRIARAGREYVERNHDWRVAGRQLEEVYQQVLEERDHGRGSTCS